MMPKKNIPRTVYDILSTSLHSSSKFTPFLELIGTNTQRGDIGGSLLPTALELADIDMVSTGVKFMQNSN